MSLIKLHKLRLGFKDNIVINGADFLVEEGDFICVVGANGSGKSTLIKGMLGLIKPFSGKVSYGDELSDDGIGYLPQDLRFDDNFPATVKEIVLSGNLGKMKGKIFYGAQERENLTKKLQLLKIEKLENAKFSELSGGQKQKVLLARSLSATSKLLILDEPSNNLDHESRKDFYKILISLNQKNGLTIIMITHDLDAEDLIGNKIISIQNGEVEMFNTDDYLRRFK